MINHHLVYTPESVVAAAGQVDCMADDDADIDCTTSSSETMQTERTSRTFIYPSSYNIAMKTLMALLALILLQLTEALISSCAIIIDGFYSTFTYFFIFVRLYARFYALDVFILFIFTSRLDIRRKVIKIQHVHRSLPGIGLISCRSGVVLLLQLTATISRVVHKKT